MGNENVDRIYELPYDDGPTNFEYLLPGKHIPQDIRQNFHPFFHQIIGMDAGTVRVLLGDLWSDLEDSSLIRMRELLLAFSPTSILVVHNTNLLLLERAIPKEYKHYNYRRDIYLLAPPKESPDLTLKNGNLLKDFYTKEADLIGSFYENFPGFRDSVPVDPEWLYLGRDFTILDESATHNSKWSPVVCLYFDLCGDGLIMKDSGEIGWHLHETNEVKKIANSFAEFINVYVAYRRDFPFSFSASPPQPRY